MQSQQITPGMNFEYLISNTLPQAMAWVTGGEAYPEISGLVKFYPTAYGGVLVAAEFFNLPNVTTPESTSFYAFHIHENGDCSQNFTRTGNHFNPTGSLHPGHAGDFPPLLGNQGYAFSVFYDKRFQIGDIMGKSVIVHSHADDFTSQPAGNSGTKIACGIIRPYTQ